MKPVCAEHYQEASVVREKNFAMSVDNTFFKNNSSEHFTILELEKKFKKKKINFKKIDQFYNQSQCLILDVNNAKKTNPLVALHKICTSPRFSSSSSPSLSARSSSSFQWPSSPC